MPSLTEQLRRLALDGGLDAVGIAAADPFDEARTRIEERKERGLHGGMHFTYGRPARSTDPGRTLATGRSLVVGALSYHRSPPTEPGAGEARVAAYQWEPYYDRLRAVLGRVADSLREAGFEAVVLVDDNRLVDRAAAHRAGLGWFGKNTNLLLPGLGSWFVLGSVLTDAELDVDPGPVPDGCGTCTRCLPACPTGALSTPGELDARRCLAWLVQADGVFPHEHRVALGDRLYGCDDCQDVCPPNRARTMRTPPPTERRDRAVVDVVELLGLDDDELMDRYGEWYIPRRRPEYLRRNALVVLGNVGDPDDPATVDAIRRHLRVGGIVAAHAVWAARRLGRLDLLDEVDLGDDPLVTAELDADVPLAGAR